MQVILLEQIQNLGTLGEEVSVKPGYARNYLIPQRKAVPATADARLRVEQRRQELAQEEAKRIEVATARAETVIKSVTIARRVGEEGRLFGSVTAGDIAEAATAAGTELARSEIQLPAGPIKEIGDFDVEVILHPEVRLTLNVSVVAEE